MTSTSSPSGQQLAALRAVENLTGPAGRLEALLNERSSGEAEPLPYSALVCHPHPLGGGTMHNKVVYRAMKTLQSFGLPVLRFNFRGTGLSAGTHDDGRGEIDDVRAALAWLEHEYGVPILFCGFSFGSYVGLRACCGDARVKGMAALGLPVRAEGRDYQYGFLAGCRQPKLFVSGSNDQFAPQWQVEAAVAAAAPPANLAIVEGADHFFTGMLEQMQQHLRGWLDSNFFSPERS
ncbi:MAG TPA: alpha/beta family hydrolase [Acidobacteriaceae bacterium]|jgi:hypothetical protein|nr:alpha/beta family hydrolase [Acidobacteriaceae bacterium]